MSGIEEFARIVGLILLLGAPILVIIWVITRRNRSVQQESELEDPVQEIVTHEKATDGGKTFSIIATIILIVAGFFIFGSCNTSKAIDNSATNAKICAEEAVRQNLKAPQTAKFCPYSEMTARNTSGRTWTVTGYVDAENSFSALIRTYWTVTLTLTESGFRDYSVDFS